jgi:P27 family predicted phage terminase small subunit
VTVPGQNTTTTAAPPSPPAWLSESGRAYWADLIRHLPGGSVTPADAHTFGMLCNELATYAEADELVQEGGIVITGALGVLMANPALAIRDRSAGAVARWLTYLKVSPADRAGAPVQDGALRHRREH